MDQRVEETGPVERKLTVDLSTAEVDAAFDAVFERLRKKARIKGFRPGRVPRSVVERYYADEARGQVLEHLVGDTLGKAVEAAELDLVTEPRLDAGEPPARGTPFSYEVRLEVRPAIELKRWKGLEVAPTPLEEPETDPVEAHLEELRQSSAPIVEEPDDTVAAAGHLVSLDFDATVGGETFEGGSGRETMAELGSGRALPGFEDALLGARAGDERSFELDLPEDHRNPEVAGKRARFEVKVHAIKRRDLPDLDDEFAKDVSEHESLEAFRAELRERVERGREEEQKRRLREAVIDALIEANPFPVPPSLVESQLHARLERALGQLRSLPDEQLRPLIERWHEEWRPAAERDVRLAFLVAEIARAESLEVGDADLDEQFAGIAAQRGTSASEVRRRYKEQGLISAVRSGLLEKRVVDLLVSEASLSSS